MLFADYGLPGGGSDKTRQLVGTVDYGRRESLSVRMGYLVLATDLNDDGFEYDVMMRGPVLEVSYHF